MADMMMTHSKMDFERLCRICLDDRELTFLFLQIGDETIADHLEYATSIEALEGDSMPQFICKKCLANVEAGYEVKKLGLETDQSLRTKLGINLLIKQEPEIVYDENMILDLDPAMIDLKTEDLFQDDEDILNLKEDMDAYDFEPTTSRKQFKSPKIKKEDKYFYKKPSTPIKSRKHERRESLQRDEATLKRYATRKAQRLDHRTSEYSCLICKTNDILNYKTYNNHMEKHKLQKDPPPHTCATCSREFYKIYAYINHKCAVRQKCFICNTEVQCFARLNFHLRKEHMNEKLECPQCLANFKSPKSLHVHIKSHTENTLHHICDFCGKQFTESLYLKNHLRLHSDFSYICDYCGKRSKTKPNFMKHLFQIHLKIKFNCDECDQVYTDKQTLKHHKVRAHGMEAAFKCEKCPEKFCYPSQLKVHDMVHHLKMKVYTKRSTTSSQEYFECKQCKKVFRSKYNFKKHCDMHEGKFAFECHICHKKSMHKHTFEAHLLTHQEEKKFHCEHCDVRMSVRANLLKHIDTVHLNIKRFRCDLCPKAFSIKTAMETHRRTHTGEKPFKCNQCEAAYGDPSTLYKHRKNIHKEEKPSISKYV